MAPGGIHELLHYRVAARLLLRVRVAAVHLHHVDAPLGERGRVRRQVELAAREPPARVRAEVDVDAQLQAARVHLYKQTGMANVINLEGHHYHKLATPHVLNHS